MRVTYVGHATVLIEVDGVRVLTDPLLRSRVFHLWRHGAVDVSSLKRSDAILVSHAHWDHLDVRSLKQVGGDSSVIVVPRGTAKYVPRGHFAEIVELDIGKEVAVGPLRVTATHAEHDGRRTPFGDMTPSLGYVVSGSTRTYFAGDTDLFAEMAALAPLDLALLPISGWGPRLPPGHLDPLRAAEALRLLEPRFAVPIHWGTYSAMTWRRPAPRRESTPADEFRRHAADLAPTVDVRVLEPGETLEFA